MSADQRTRATLVALEKIRVDLGLPVESLRTIFNIWEVHQREIESIEHMRQFMDGRADGDFIQPADLMGLARPRYGAPLVRRPRDNTDDARSNEELAQARGALTDEQLIALGIKPR